jgi:hypothetical protein
MNASTRFLPLVGLIFASCEDGSQVSTGGFDPLDPAGGFGAQTQVVDSEYRPGEFVEASMANTAFFKRKPQGEAEADTLLPAGTPLKVISTDGSFVKVERDSGEVGFVPEIMVINSGANDDSSLSGAETQVWPPPTSDGIIPLGDGEGMEDDNPQLPPTIDPDDPDDVPPLPEEDGDLEPGGVPPLPGDDDSVPDPADDGISADEPGADAVAPPIRTGGDSGNGTGETETLPGDEDDAEDDADANDAE